MCLDGSDAALVLQNAMHQQIWMTDDGHFKSREHVGLEYDVHDTGFILQTEEDKAFGGLRLLAADDHACNSNGAAVTEVLHLRCGDDVHSVKLLAVETHGVRSDRESGVGKISLKTFDGVHRLQRRGRFRWRGVFQQFPGWP